MQKLRSGTMDGSMMQSGVTKVMKKQMKDELDRIKYAERKKRRLEKALAASAVIRSELEKKKLKRKEEQQRLDEERALIAKAVALHVLLDDSFDDSCKGLQMKFEEINQWEYNRFGLLTSETIKMVPRQNISKHSLGGIRFISDSYGYGNTWNEPWNCDFVVSSEPLDRNLSWPYIGGGGLESTTGMSAGLAAAQAFSSLKLGDETSLDSYVLNPTLRG